MRLGRWEGTQKTPNSGGWCGPHSLLLAGSPSPLCPGLRRVPPVLSSPCAWSPPTCHAHLSSRPHRHRPCPRTGSSDGLPHKECPFVRPPAFLQQGASGDVTLLLQAVPHPHAQCEKTRELLARSTRPSSRLSSRSRCPAPGTRASALAGPPAPTLQPHLQRPALVPGVTLACPPLPEDRSSAPPPPNTCHVAPTTVGAPLGCSLVNLVVIVTDSTLICRRSEPALVRFPPWSSAPWAVRLRRTSVTRVDR